MAKLPFYVELFDLTEFARLACALERIPRTSLSFTLNQERVISVQMDVLKERPVNYYVPSQKSGHYLSYGFKGAKEDCDVVNAMINPTYLYSPIVRMKSLPESLKPDLAPDPTIRYESLELEDLNSLIKLSYGFEESPFPLFAFSSEPDWFIGVFMNFNESDETSYFCYVKLSGPPNGPFLKYSIKDGTEPSFVNGINEHGYSYLKVIKLKDKHQLVKL